MKNSILFILLILLISSCEEKNQLVAPDNSATVENANWLKLPLPKGLSVESNFHSTYKVKKDKEAKIKIKEEYLSANGKVKIDAELKIKKNTIVYDEIDITMNIDIYNSTISFTPSTYLLEPGELKLKFEGLDIDDLEEGDVKFIFAGQYGTIEDVEFDEIKLDKKKGKIELKKGKIKNFSEPFDPSRYGFVR